MVKFKDLKCLCLGLLANSSYLAAMLVSVNSDGKSEVIISCTVLGRIW